MVAKPSVVRRLAALAVIGAVIFAVAAMSGWREEALRADYERVADTPAPPGFAGAGVTLSGGTGPTMVIQTDLTCPTCQDFFATHGEEIRAMVDAETAHVSLAVLAVRDGSALNALALDTYFAVVGSHPDRALDAYLSLSSAVQGLPDDVDVATARERMLDRLPAELRPLAEDPPPLPSRTSDWLLARTLENRLEAGVVPALVVDGVPVVGPDIVSTLVRMQGP